MMVLGRCYRVSCAIGEDGCTPRSVAADTAEACELGIEFRWTAATGGMWRRWWWCSCAGGVQGAVSVAGGW